jgi:fucose permease
VTQTTTINRTDVVRVGIAYLSFIVLGMPGAMLGVAWSPAIANTFELELDAVGALFIVTMGSYFIASFISGRLVNRFGFGTLLVAGSLISGVGLVGYVLSPAWALMVAFGVLVGGGSGVVDAGMNIYFAAHYGPRLMNWLHASFGIGAALSPLLMTGILNSGGEWRTGYIILALLFAGIGILFGLTRGHWNKSKLASGSEATHRGVSAWDTLRLPLAWIGIGIFFLYGGQETIPGYWGFSLFTEARRLNAETAGLLVSIYWLCFTLGRIVFGLIVSWVKARTLLNICVAGTIIGALLLWLPPAPEAPATILNFIGLGLFGFTIGPIFALIITSTQERLGPLHAPHAIGFQVAAASVGGGILPGIAGRLAVTNDSLEVVPVFLLVITLIMVVLYIGSTRPALSVHAQPVPAGD